MRKALVALLIGASISTLQACSEANSSGSEASSSAASTRNVEPTDCRKLVYHPLDGDGRLYAARVTSRSDAIAACKAFIRANDADPEGYERLAVAYSSSSDDGGVSAEDRAAGIESFRKAAALGSAYAPYVLARIALDHYAGVEDLSADIDAQRSTAYQALYKKIADGSNAAKILYINLLMHEENNRLAQMETLKARGVPEKLSDFAAIKSEFLTVYYDYLEDQHACPRSGLITAEQRLETSPPNANFPACRLVLSTAAATGDAYANYRLGVLHVRIAKEMFEAKTGDWKEMSRAHLTEARKALIVASQNDDGFTKYNANQLIEDIDSVSYADESSAGSGMALVFAGLLALGAMSAGSEQASSDDGDYYDRQAKENCERRRSYQMEEGFRTGVFMAETC